SYFLQNPKMNTDYLKTIPLFLNLSQEQLNFIESCSRKFSVTKGTVIIYQEDNSLDLFIILSGKINVSLLHEDGREVTLDILTQGDFFGELSLFDKNPRSATVTAISDSKILILPRVFFIKLMMENPDMIFKFLQVMAARLRKADEKIDTLTFLDVCGRVSKLIIDLAKRKGEKLPDSTIKIRCPTHQVIANQIGASRESVTKALKSLISKGLINVKDKELVISQKQFEIL
ncbi:MAG TPA: Crp/Fnr family transcriptional regulator, partial [Candidatus Brocadiaceae bacterium]